MDSYRHSTIPDNNDDSTEEDTCTEALETDKNVDGALTAVTVALPQQEVRILKDASKQSIRCDNE